MKIKTTLIILFLLTLDAGNLDAQSGKVPPFRMMLTDGTVFKAQYLPMGKSILIIYFSPDCEECHKFTTALMTRMKELSNVSIAMITYQPVKNITEYVNENHLLEYSNVYAGSEYPSLFVRDYYNVIHFPYVALYNKNGELVKKYTDKEISVDDLLSRIRMLK
ncbi:MAG TPA: hypothetical protein VHO46_16280 [Bacteroidales bacterium]|nr:hypothetical protein [Bacteroidales bacterium]